VRAALFWPGVLVRERDFGLDLVAVFARVFVFFRVLDFAFAFAFAVDPGCVPRFGFGRAVNFGIASARAISRALAAPNSGATRSASQRSNSTSSG
jgi:hypothetical protein